MTPGHGVRRPRDLVLTVTPGTATPEWCPACKAFTRLAGDLLLLDPGGVTVVGRYAWCQICDDPRMPKEARRV
ncbi:hypothetical protein ACFC09_15530 [Streptomyces sp. NPDC056161]|uniref:hypothetical protein n=1 Tax=Streptomyces sp. NPDC056161 TaxID=3345732 RepID=UPI0035DB830A